MPDLAWLFLILPLASAAAIQLFLKRNANLSALVATASAGITLALSLLLLDKQGSASFAWATAGDFAVRVGLLLDGFSTRMMVIVTGIGFLVHVFSLGYMADDEAKSRYFAGLSVFMWSMSGIVLADNFIMTFMFWELVGFSSYLLIGHWYRKASAADAAKKAFIVNRIGDFGFMTGILLLWSITGHLSFAGMKEWAAGDPGVSRHLLTTAILCVFCGAVGKSAQVPLHIWLPDAMEGPTPVSALIHAATMVAAGVYMMVRLQLSIGTESFAGTAATVIAAVGAITALLAALMATQQNDIKRILAYSTLSQLGYMVMAVGCLAGPAAMFHLFTHAWFKALLFLGSGAVIHACHHEQDIFKLGGLAGKMRWTTLTFAAATAALVAIPGTSGFFSKEQILVAARETHPLFFWTGVAVAGLTTFYMLRLFFIAFLGKARSHGAEQAREVGPAMLVPLLVLAVPSVVGGWPWIAGMLSPAYHHHGFHAGIEFKASVGAILAGAIAAFALYFNKDKDVLAAKPLARLLAAKFYIDEFYAQIVRWLQDGVATAVHLCDEFVINGLFVGGLSRSAETGGSWLRRLQSGNLQAYVFLIGLGAVLVICFTAF